jgi:trigger factor
MQVSVESGEGLERHLKVAVPAERIEQEVERRLQSLARRANISGFRPGKAPLRVVSQKYGGQVRGEVIGELMRSTLEEAMRQENLNPVSGPKIETKPQAAGEDLEYIATFEVYPSVDLASLEAFVVERPVAEVAEADVDAMMGRLREQRVRWVPVDRPAQAGDRVTFDYEGTVEGREQDIRAQAVTAVLGSEGLLFDLDQALAAARPGDHVTATLKFPEAYPAKEVAGRAGQFTVTVTAVEAKELPEIDEIFARGFGVREGGVVTLRQEVAANMRRELEQAVRGRVKNQVMDLLLQAHPIDLPLSLVTQEIQRLRAQLSGADTESPQALPDSTIEAAARRRVALGLIILEFARRNGIKASADRVRAAVDGLASTYEEPDAVARWIYGDRRQLAEIESLVIEDQVVDWVLQRVRVNEVPADFDTLVRGHSHSSGDGQGSDGA